MGFDSRESRGAAAARPEAVERQVEKEQEPSGYHNRAVDAYRESGSVGAMKVVREGLVFFPYDIDLLADAMRWSPVGLPENWASHSGAVQSYAEDYYKLLKTRRRYWTWRAYSFAVDYLVDRKLAVVKPGDVEGVLNDADDISREFITRFPYDERSYSSRYDVLMAQGKRDEARALLRVLVLGEGNSSSRNVPAPSCSSDLADMLLEEGDYETAVKVAQKGIVAAAQMQPGMNVGYLVCAKALAHDALFQQGHPNLGFTALSDADKQTVQSIFALYRTARALIPPGSTFVATIRRRIMLLEGLTGLSCDAPEREAEDDDDADRGLAELLAKLDAFHAEES